VQGLPLAQNIVISRSSPTVHTASSVERMVGVNSVKQTSATVTADISGSGKSSQGVAL